MLFSVIAGIPIENALENASSLLASAKAITLMIIDADRTADSDALYAVMHLMEMAKAAIDATH